MRRNSKLVIFGTGEIAELADFYFHHDSDLDVAAFAVDGAYLKEDAFCGKPVVAMEELAAHFPPTATNAFVAVSYAKLNELRTQKVTQMSDEGYRLASYVSSKATVFPGFSPGHNAFILEDNTIQPFVRIGDNVTLWSGNHIGHHSVIEDNCFLASHIVVSGGVRIGAGSFVGVNVTIRDHVTIGRRCVIGAGALMLENADDEGVYAPRGTERARVPSSRLRSI
ncbi:acetyltransferase [Aurantimonas sp. A3-2-R12]|uniref:acetyltransferase n=1 Tax=Aurantimonas sp. A3-2-R12 TaxID=3114362 RepID=UPI002E17EB98|nr:acetyltransferase [Aurantimonas sp. A3-2-R12]